MKEVAQLVNAMREAGVITNYAVFGATAQMRREVSAVIDLTDLFRRQAEWQKARARLSWSEKLKLAEVLRDAAVAMRPSGRQTDKPDARKSRSE